MRAPIAQGELRHVVVTLRQLLTAYDSVSFVMDGSLEDIDPTAEDLATALRPQLRDTANGIYDLLARIEQLDSYVQLRKRELQTNGTTNT